jgi:cytochrome c peroxidase
MNASLKTGHIALQTHALSANLFPAARTAKISKFVLSCMLLAGQVILCTSCKKPASDKPIGATVQITVPLGLPPVPIPADNPPTAETIALGRKLFYDKKLSKDNSLACAFCHNPLKGFTDALPLSRGVGGTTGIRNAPTIVNAAYLPFQFWDGRAISLEEQAASPIADPLEMNQSQDVSVS